MSRRIPAFALALAFLASAPVYLLAQSPGAAPAPPAVSAERGQALEGLAMKSAILDRDVRYTVYLPPGYAQSSRRYPVVYLLHGLTGCETDWIQYGELPAAADGAIAAGEIPPMIVVMPDGGNEWYVNEIDPQAANEDMLVREFVPFIDATYRTRTDREFRAVSGLSMGGWGSLGLAMRHPDLFSSCAAFSAAVWTDDDFAGMKAESYDRMLGRFFGPGLSGRARLNARYRAANPLDLAAKLPEDVLKKVGWYIDCGDDDFLTRGNCALHLVLTDRKIPHQYRVRDGEHSWEYWRTGLVEGLKFIGGGFRR